MIKKSVILAAAIACIFNNVFTYALPYSEDTGIYVVNSLEETLTYINPWNRITKPRIITTGQWPNGIYFHKSLCYVVNSGDNNIQVIDIERGVTVATIDTGTASNPWAMAFSGNYGYATCLVSEEVIQIDLSTNEVRARVSVPGGPGGIAVYNNKVYVAQTRYNWSTGVFDDGGVAVIDGQSLALKKSVLVGINPQCIFQDFAGRMHVICSGNNGFYSPFIEGVVYIIDTTQDTVTGTVNIGGSPNAFSVTDSGLCYVCGWYGGVRAYDTSTGEIMHGEGNVLLDETALSGLLYHDKTQTLFISKFDTDEVLGFLPKEKKIDFSIYSGDGPQQMAYYQNELPSSMPEYGDIQDIRIGPNPFRISGEGERMLIDRIPESYAVKIYDIAGNLVRAIYDNTKPNKRYWNGKDESGNSVSSGLYVVYIYNKKRVSENRRMKLVVIRE